MSVVTSMPRKPLAQRMASFWGKWAVASPLAVVAVVAINAVSAKPFTPPTLVDVGVTLAFFSVFSAGIGFVIASAADPAFRDDSSPGEMARALYLIAPGWILANLISYAWPVFIAVGLLGIVVAGWRTLLH